MKEQYPQREVSYRDVGGKIFKVINLDPEDLSQVPRSTDYEGRHLRGIVHLDGKGRKTPRSDTHWREEH